MLETLHQGLLRRQTINLLNVLVDVRKYYTNSSWFFFYRAGSWSDDHKLTMSHKQRIKDILNVMWACEFFLSLKSPPTGLCI